MKKSKTIIRILSSILTTILLILTALLFSATLFINQNHSNQNIDEMLFYLFNGIRGASLDVFIDAITKSLLPFILIILALFLPIIPIGKRKNIIEVQFKDREYSFTLLPSHLFRRFRFSYTVIMLLLSVFVSYKTLDISDYFERLNSYSTIIGDYYVSGTDISITFPEEKRNLIILYLESTENTFIDKADGGGWDYSVIPELENIAKENINFSNTEKIGGALPISGTEWTVAGLVASASGIPLKIPVGQNLYNFSDSFLPGAYSLGDILQKEGYNLGVMFGSEANFGGRSNYYMSHGNYRIFDLNTAIEEGRMLESEKVWWGFDDTHLFTWAKEEIRELANLEKPFSFSFLTVNTHFPNGYLESGAEKVFGTQYENVFAHSSKQVEEFVNWLQQQEFFNNTTLVIIGDHLSMQDSGFFNAYMKKGYERTIYNAFINTTTEPLYPKNRVFTTLDMYPTILASIGVGIEGNRLGIGTNLFSDRKTLVEELGYDYVNDELKKNSTFYNTHILQDDYLDLLDKAEKLKEKKK
jgi:phosphoglycerol transferase